MFLSIIREFEKTVDCRKKIVDDGVFLCPIFVCRFFVLFCHPKCMRKRIDNAQIEYPWLFCCCFFFSCLEQSVVSGMLYFIGFNHGKSEKLSQSFTRRRLCDCPRKRHCSSLYWVEPVICPCLRSFRRCLTYMHVSIMV